ncbi:MAG TPA: nitroreductase [Gammaproteobacteria bacterium]|jgi:nitroreductase
MNIINVMKTRKSCRAFLDRDVDADKIHAVLDAARWAPSGVNMQPWRVTVVRGESRARISDALLAARKAGQEENPDYQYYPGEWFEPYKSRRKATGLALYGALQIGREDNRARTEAWYNNYRFFGAPVGLLVFLDRRLGQGSWVDIGMFLQNLMLAAESEGLATCPQASLAEYPDIVRGILGIGDEMALVCGLSLGYADPDAAVNGYRTPREPVDAFTTWHE